MPSLIPIYRAYQSDAAFARLRADDNPFVPGMGSLSPRAILIGEAPGKNEARLCMPFVGAAGDLLEQLLSSIKLDRDDVFITNLVKYRPVIRDLEMAGSAAANRPPTDQEKLASLPYLRDEVMAVDCKLLVPMGAHALSAVLPNHVVSEIHGRVFNKAGGWRVLPLYHPAAALYNQSLKPVLFEDFKKLKEAIRAEERRSRPTASRSSRRGRG